MKFQYHLVHFPIFQYLRMKMFWVGFKIISIITKMIYLHISPFANELQVVNKLIKGNVLRTLKIYFLLTLS